MKNVEEKKKISHFLYRRICVYVYKTSSFIHLTLLFGSPTSSLSNFVHLINQKSTLQAQLTFQMASSAPSTTPSVCIFHQASSSKSIV